jgi:metallophosphoesterase superfamily enzyme
MKDLLILNVAKPKSIIINGDLHKRFKVLCKNKSLKIGGVIEDLIRLYLENPKKIQLMIEDSKEVKIN